MISSKIIECFMTGVLLFSTSVKSQTTLTPNATLFLPGGDDLNPGAGDVIVASEVTVEGGSTFYQLLPTNPTATEGQFLTVTIALTPTEIQVDTSDPDDGVISDIFDCSIHGDEADCIETAILVENGTTTSTDIETETASAVRISVVALNFGQPSLPTAIPTFVPTSPPTLSTPTPTSAAGKVSFSIGLLSNIVFLCSLV
ncbi:hypothetical protein Clacol_009567 [Clathrus columnatus]|uniref:Uncharacterized protein n=1 Tax=Clathrus columnatus TaxID=1419009 RepID=A0AAV5ASG9_9AGAM|nr:hypothetical protein Clacol_009567 [Clathrus columnatus]